MKLERLIYILLALLNKRKITAKEIAERFEISTRTVYRDMDALSLAGIPVYSERGDKGGFYIPDDYKMDSSFFTEEEKQFIINMSQNVAKLLAVQVLTILSISLLLKRRLTRSIHFILISVHGLSIQIIYLKWSRLYKLGRKFPFPTILKNKNEVSERFFLTV